MLLNRTETALENAGQQKGEIIANVQKQADEFANGILGDNQVALPGAQNTIKSGLDVKALRKAIQEKLTMNPNLPDAESYNQKLEDFVSRFAKGRDIIPLDEADKLKVAIGKTVKDFHSKIGADPVQTQFNKELYHKLNQGIDEATQYLAEKFGQPTGALKEVKSRYGNLAAAKSNLEERNIADTANRLISPSDYGTGIGTLAGALAAGKTMGASAALGAGASALNKFLRQYGQQLSAKQFDNLSRLIKSPAVQNIMLVSPATTGKAQVDRQTKARLKALEGVE